MARSDISVAVAVVSVVLVVVAAGFVEAQEQDCVSKLTACGEFLKSNNPPASCCDPIKQTVAEQLDCLCNVYNTPGFLQSIGVNVSDALHLTKACGVSDDLSKCKTSAPAPHQVPPPGVPGNDADQKVVLSGFTSLFLLFASLIFY